MQPTDGIEWKTNISKQGKKHNTNSTESEERENSVCRMETHKHNDRDAMKENVNKTQNNANWILRISQYYIRSFKYPFWKRRWRWHWRQPNDFKVSAKCMWHFSLTLCACAWMSVLHFDVRARIKDGYHSVLFESDLRLCSSSSSKLYSILYTNSCVSVCLYV